MLINFADQGLDTHIKAISTYAFCIDSRPNSKNSVEWFVQNHLLGGFVNSNIRKLCNARYVIIDDEMIKPIKKGQDGLDHFRSGDQAHQERPRDFCASQNSVDDNKPFCLQPIQAMILISHSQRRAMVDNYDSSK